METPPPDWRDKAVTADNSLDAMEKETSLRFPNDEGTGMIYSDVATIIKWVQSVDESDAVGVHLSDSGAIVGVKAIIPKGVVKLQGNSRKSNSHSQMVTYGPQK